MDNISGENNVNNMQVSIKYPTLPEIISQNSCEVSESEQSSTQQALRFFSKPLRISFLKELEEAENEPFLDFEHKDGDVDELDAKEDEEMSQLDISEVGVLEVDQNLKDTSVFSNEKLSNVNQHVKPISQLDIGEVPEVEPTLKDNSVFSSKELSNVKPSNGLLLVTPAKQPYFNDFLTPNVTQFNKPNCKAFLTQIQTKTRFKTQSRNSCNTNIETPSDKVFSTNRDIAGKKSLFFSNKVKANNDEVIYEDTEGSFKIENNQKFDDGIQRILYTSNSNIKTPTNTVSFINRQSAKKNSLLCQEKKDENNFAEEKQMENKENMQNKQNTEESTPKVLCSIPVEKPLLEPFEKIVVNKVEYVILNQIGHGGSSVVFHCYDAIDKCERAIKRVSLTGDKTCIQGYINEVKMLHKLQNSDRIIKMYSYEIIVREKVLFMVLEKGERDLSKILKEISTNTNRLPMYMLIYYWMEMLYAVKQIHANGIIHSDLKPANFLMVSSKLKLIDFGIASSLQNDMTSVVKNVQIGSFNYISPEALSNDSRDSGTAKFKISFKSDVWSLGCILYQLVYRKTPFQHIGHTYAKLSAIVDPNHVIEYPSIGHVPENIIRTVKSCLQYNMKSRPSVDDLIKDFENMYY